MKSQIVKWTLLICFLVLSWNLHTQDAKLELVLPQGHNTPVIDLSFSENGKYLLSATRLESQLRLWDVERQKLLYSSPSVRDILKTSNNSKISIFQDVHISPEGKFILINGKVLWNTHTGEFVQINFGTPKKFFDEDYLWTWQGIVNLKSNPPKLIADNRNELIEVQRYEDRLLSVIATENKSYVRNYQLIDVLTGEEIWKITGPEWIGSKEEMEFKIFVETIGPGKFSFDANEPILYMRLHAKYLDSNFTFLSGDPDIPGREDMENIAYETAAYNFQTNELVVGGVEIPNKGDQGSYSKNAMKEIALSGGIPEDSIALDGIAYSEVNQLVAVGLKNGDIILMDENTGLKKRVLQSKVYPGLVYFANDSTINHVTGGLENDLLDQDLLNMMMRDKRDEMRSGKDLIKERASARSEKLRERREQSRQRSRELNIAFLRDIEARKISWNLHNNLLLKDTFSVDPEGFFFEGKDLSNDDKLNAVFFTRDFQKAYTFQSRDKQHHIEIIPESRTKEKLITYHDGSTIKLIEDLESLPGFIPFVCFSADNRYIFHSTPENMIVKYDLINNRKVSVTGKHDSRIMMLNVSPNGRWLVSSSLDGSNKLFDLQTTEELASISFINSTDWVVTTPSGLFDATRNAMKEMYYVYDKKEIIDLEQLKSRYWEPGLLQKIMGFQPGGLRSVESFNQIKIYPELTANIVEDKLQYQLQSREGGIGKLSLWINDKRVSEDINPDRSDDLRSVSLVDYQRYMIPNHANQITLRCYNKEGWLVSPEFQLSYTAGGVDSKGEELSINLGNRVGSVKVYGLFVGTNDYNGDALDLKFADQDAKAMYQAVKASASALWGADMLDLKLLSTSNQNHLLFPSKENIRKILKEDFSEAKPTDILFVYFSGHGVAYSTADSETSQFYYLTKDVGDFDLSDSELRNNYTISSGELEDWITDIPSLYQILVIDACNSGTIVSNINPGAKSLKADQIKAIDRMKDRTGMNIIVGSAADKVSFEASEFGQGLLTYSLLLGMQNAALRENKFVDVSRLFNFAADQVPQFAKGLNKIQQPQLLLGASFDLGIVDESVSIPLASKKPVMIKSNFQNEDLFRDNLKFSQALDDYFRELSLQTNEFLFMELDEKEGAYNVLGRYVLEAGNLKITGKIFKGDSLLRNFEVSGHKDHLEDIHQKIHEELITAMQK